MRAALIYQHATSQRDRAIADALDRMMVDEASDESARASVVGHEMGTNGSIP